MFDLDTHKYFVSHDVKFVEIDFPFANSSLVHDVPFIGDVEYFDDDIIHVGVEGELVVPRDVGRELAHVDGVPEATEGLVEVGPLLAYAPTGVVEAVAPRVVPRATCGCISGSLRCGGDGQECGEYGR